MSTLAYRELYAPAHFGNSYEVAADYEITDVLKEAIDWGFNAYGDWFDTADLNDPHNNPKNHYLLPQAIWERKIRSFQIASKLGLETNLVVLPNHVFQDQLTNPKHLADTSGDDRMFGQLLCPSIPEARKVILDNQRRLFQDLKEAGVILDSITGGPYDYGGCSCPKCDPWIVTFGKLMSEIHSIALEYFPMAKARLFGWWWTQEETRMFKEWADREAPGKFVSLSGYIVYGNTHPDPEIALAEGCELHAFVHIGYGDSAEPREVYGWWGPSIAATRLEKTINDLESMGATGFAAYSEGFSDDVNKAILAGITSGKFSDASSVLEAYAKRYFGSDNAESERWAKWLWQWRKPFEVDVEAARRDLNALTKDVSPGWRRDQWESKMRLFELNAVILNAKSSEARDEAISEFYTERDRMNREIWKLGLVRHILNAGRYASPSWETKAQNAESNDEA